MKPNLTTKNVLVTGGAGFIGSHLVERLVAKGCQVLVVDNLHKGRVESIQHLLRCDGFGLETGDIRDDAVLSRLIDRGPFDVLYHLAAMHYIPECMIQPGETLSVNVLGTQALVSIVPCRRFVFASTGDVYAPKDAAHAETDALRPFNVYGLSKLFCEQLLGMTSLGSEATTFVVARLFNVYGSGETNSHLIPRIVDEIKRGQCIRLGNLWTRRDYTHVADTVNALLALGELELQSAFEVFNVGTAVATSVEHVVKLFEEILGTSLRIEVDPDRSRQIDRLHLQADIKKLHNATEWLPQYSLRDGLKQLCLQERLLR